MKISADRPVQRQGRPEQAVGLSCGRLLKSVGLWAATLTLTAAAACGGEVHVPDVDEATLTPIAYAHQTTQEGQEGQEGQERPIVFILSGQSNMWGMANVSRLSQTSYLDSPSNVSFNYAEPESIVLIKDSSVAHAVNFGPEISLIHLLSAKYLNRKVIIVKFAVKGTTIHHWNPNYDQVSSFIHALDPDGTTPAHYERLYEKLIHYVLEAVAQEGAVEYGGMFWMQGESDAVHLNFDYLTLMKEFISRIRRDLGAAHMPFVLGRIHTGTNGCPWGDQWSESVYLAEIQHIRSEQMKLKNHLSQVVDVETKYLSCYPDDVIHFDESSQIKLGSYLYRGLLRVDSASNKVDLQANDGVLCFGANEAQRSIIAYYNEYCYRCPDLGGLAYWTSLVENGTATLGQVASNIQGICADVGLLGMSKCARQRKNAEFSQCPSGWGYLPNYSSSCFNTCQ